jgi:hypothetical protein
MEEGRERLKRRGNGGRLAIYYLLRETVGLSLHVGDVRGPSGEPIYAMACREGNYRLVVEHLWYLVELFQCSVDYDRALTMVRGLVQGYPFVTGSGKPLLSLVEEGDSAYDDLLLFSSTRHKNE